jgi:hypothetical protein
VSDRQFSIWKNPAIKIAATSSKAAPSQSSGQALLQLKTVGEGRLCHSLVQIYLPPQIKLRIARLIHMMGNW